jgi:hypothetical protein
MEKNEVNKTEKLKDLTTVVGILIEGDYNFTGIAYLYVSSSDHVLSHKFRGVEIKYSRGQMERISKGANERLDIFAYYNNKCFILIK